MIADCLCRELRELEDIRFLMHCSIESVRCMWVSLTQGECMPDEADYDALYGVYKSLFELDERLLEKTQVLYKVASNLARGGCQDGRKNPADH